MQALLHCAHERASTRQAPRRQRTLSLSRRQQSRARMVPCSAMRCGWLPGFDTTCTSSCGFSRWNASSELAIHWLVRARARATPSAPEPHRCTPRQRVARVPNASARATKRAHLHQQPAQLPHTELRHGGGGQQAKQQRRVLSPPRKKSLKARSLSCQSTINLSSQFMGI